MENTYHPVSVHINYIVLLTSRNSLIVLTKWKRRASHDGPFTLSPSPALAQTRLPMSNPILPLFPSGGHLCDNQGTDVWRRMSESPWHLEQVLMTEDSL